eukprot:2109342-Rhodomonas_salina.2
MLRAPSSNRLVPPQDISVPNSAVSGSLVAKLYDLGSRVWGLGSKGGPLAEEEGEAVQGEHVSRDLHTLAQYCTPKRSIR